MLLFVACLLIAAMKLPWGWYGIAAIIWLTERILVASWQDFLVNKTAALIFEAQVQSVECKACVEDQQQEQREKQELN